MIGQIGSSGGSLVVTAATAPAGLTYTGQFNNATVSTAEWSFPITSVSVAGTAFATQVAGAVAMAQIGLKYVASSTAGPPGALSYAQGSAYLPSLNLGATPFGTSGSPTGAFSIIMPEDNSTATIGGIGTPDGFGYIRNLISRSGSANLYIGDVSTNNSGGDAITVEKSLSVAGDTSMTNNPRMSYEFNLNQQTTLVSNEHMGTLPDGQAHHLR